jgi:hypothetical protein
MSAVSPADLIEIITPYGIVVFTETQYEEAN